MWAGGNQKTCSYQKEELRKEISIPIVRFFQNCVVKRVIKTSSVTASRNLILCMHVVHPYRSLTLGGHLDVRWQPPCSRPQVQPMCISGHFKFPSDFADGNQYFLMFLFCWCIRASRRTMLGKPQRSRSKAAFRWEDAAWVSLVAGITEPYLRAARCHRHRVGWEALKTAVFWP